MRAIWKGSVVFGRLAIPVGVAPTRAGGAVEFRSIHRDCGTPIERRRYCPTDERLVEESEVVKGWEVAPGNFVHVEDAELDAIAPDDEARTIVLAEFVDDADFDPLWIERSYYLAPSEHAVMRKAYAALAEALQDSSTIALGRWVAFNAEHLVGVRTVGRGLRTLVLHTLAYPADVVAPDPIEDALEGAGVTAEEHELAVELAVRLTRPLAKTGRRPLHRERVRELLDAKLAGREIVQTPAAAAPDVVEPAGLDLEAALRKSLRAAPRRRRATVAG